MKIQKNTPWLMVLALLVAACFSIAPAANAGDTSSRGSAEVAELLAQVKSKAVTLEKDTEHLAQWTMARQVSWQTHTAQINVIRGHINEAGKLLTRLNETRTTASPWQHEAMDRIQPLLQELADNTTTLIDHLNDSKHNVHLSDYRDSAKAGADTAKELAALVRDYVEYGEHEAEFRRLQDKLTSATS
jgi:hypothetical protein